MQDSHKACLSTEEIEQLYKLRGECLLRALKHLDNCIGCRRTVTKRNCEKLVAKFRQQIAKTGIEDNRENFREFLIEDIISLK